MVWQSVTTQKGHENMYHCCGQTLNQNGLCESDHEFQGCVYPVEEVFNFFFIFQNFQNHFSKKAGKVIWNCLSSLELILSSGYSFDILILKFSCTQTIQSSFWMKIHYMAIYCWQYWRKILRECIRSISNQLFVIGPTSVHNWLILMYYLIPRISMYIRCKYACFFQHWSYS